MYSFVQRFQLSCLAAGRAERVRQQHRRVARPAYPVHPELAVTHRREDTCYGAATAADAGGVEGLLPLGWVQPQPTAVSLKLAWGRTPTRGNLCQTLPFYCFPKSGMKPNKNLQNLENLLKFAKPRKQNKNLHN